MPFTIALSGLNAASADLAVTANNIANGSTSGFKSSRTEFADLFAVTPFGVSSTATGNGVKVSSVAQQFTQGNIDFTDSNLDLALSGDGFFTLSDAGSLAYSRAGAFKVDNQGYVVSGTGARLQVFPPLPNGGFNTGGLADLRLVTSESAPQATGMIDMTLNLPADATAPVTAFDPADASSYNRQTSMTVYDSLGAAHTTSFYFVKGALANEWTVQAYTDGTAVGTPQALTFNSSGALVTPAAGTIAFPPYTPATGAAPLALTLDVTGATQYGSNFGVQFTQDGFTTGALSGIDVDPTGVVSARYTNGRSVPLGQVAITTFANVQGLQKLGDTQWGETFTSGGAQRGTAGSSGYGQIQSGALEASNVEITQQLVNMIIAQRNFQANAQMISTADQITQTIINIR
ncbi:MAG TPA: flagellar hook protein FlgE [Steroidobacteraceae bacterium]|nr:flagellar hook protein FlgE [Steroidobacteraceae bacterium]